MHRFCAVLVAVLALTLLRGCANTRVERHGAPQQGVVRRIYSADLESFRAAVLDKFRELPNATIVPFRSMRVIELKPPNYPPDWLMAWVDPGDFLRPYKQIDASRRVHDLLIEEPTGDTYWPSEYETAAGPVKFRCGFILHFEPRDALSTEIQVYEKVPEIWAGERWDLLHHGIGFGKVHNIRFVEPTVKDRLDLLDVLKSSSLLTR